MQADLSSFTMNVSLNMFYMMATKASLRIAAILMAITAASADVQDQLMLYKNDSTMAFIATDYQGKAVPSLTQSLRVNPDGPVLMRDKNLLDHLAHFDGERIPERVTHAKGAGARGFFQLSKDLSKCTKASILTNLKKTTPVFCRFSTAVRERGSADTLPDPRGIACKFYTDEGNWDFLGVTTTAFAIADPLLFSSLLRSLKRNPRTNIYDPNQLWNFRHLRPESVLNSLQVLSDLAFPDGYRHASAHAIHAFKLVNSRGGATFCKFHLIADAGPKNLTAHDAFALAGLQPDYNTADLFNAIAHKNFPSWSLKVQLMSLQQAIDNLYNPFDATKEWLVEDFPMITVGKVTLNQNPENFFAEVEQSAFCPGNLVPGIQMSPDPLLHGRAFSYGDTQRRRLGINFEQLPINRPKVPVHSYFRDGPCCVTDNGGSSPNYFPNMFNGPKVIGHEVENDAIDAIVDRWELTDVDDDQFYFQPKNFINKLSSGELERLVANGAYFFSFLVSDVQENIFKMMGKVSPALGAALRAAVVQIQEQDPTNIRPFLLVGK